MSEASPATSRVTGFYWIKTLAGLQVARWDATLQGWHLTGTDEGEDPELVTVLAGPLSYP